MYIVPVNSRVSSVSHIGRVKSLIYCIRTINVCQRMKFGAKGHYRACGIQYFKTPKSVLCTRSRNIVNISRIENPTRLGAQNLLIQFNKLVCHQPTRLVSTKVGADNALVVLSVEYIFLAATNWRQTIRPNRMCATITRGFVHHLVVDANRQVVCVCVYVWGRKDRVLNKSNTRKQRLNKKLRHNTNTSPFRINKSLVEFVIRSFNNKTYKKQPQTHLMVNKCWSRLFANYLAAVIFDPVCWRPPSTHHPHATYVPPTTYMAQHIYSLGFSISRGVQHLQTAPVSAKYTKYGLLSTRVARRKSDFATRADCLFCWACKHRVCVCVREVSECV